MGISINSFLKIKTIRIIICKIRFFYFTKFRKAIKVLDSKDSINFRISHNLKGLYYFGI